MRFPVQLVPARLIRRYNRFLADATLESSGQEVTVHCPNPGAMLGLKEPGLRIWLEPNDDPKRKLKYGWRLVELADGTWVGIDTGVPNRVIGAALRAGQITPLSDYQNVRAEVRYGKDSRVDFLLKQEGLPDTYVEVKNVHLLRESDWAEFPDCVTERGAKHLRVLSDMVDQGQRAVMIYLVQHMGCGRFRLADDLDPAYAAAFARARKAGVEALCYGTRIDVGSVSLGPRLPIVA
ncbi:MAG: DNA/RNA nuclease SfsA [Pseudomonadota bacterium]